MRDIINVIKVFVGAIMYTAVAFALTVVLWCISGALVITLLESLGLTEESANLAAMFLLPVVGILVCRFAIRDYQARVRKLEGC